MIIIIITLKNKDDAEEEGRRGWLGKVNNDCKPWLETRINKLWDFNFLSFSVFVVVAGKWIEACDFCNNLSEQSVSRCCCCRPTSLNSQTAQTERSSRRRRRTDSSDTKDFTPNSHCCCTSAALQCSNRGDRLLKRLSMEVKSGVSWCRAVLAAI